jgi:hypothetical protein
MSTEICKRHWLQIAILFLVLAATTARAAEKPNKIHGRHASGLGKTRTVRVAIA